MSDNPTRETPDARSFEERVFARFDALERNMEARFSRLEDKVDAVDARLTALEDKVEARLRETRPIWEAMQSDLAHLKDAVKDIKRSLKIMHQDLLRVRGEQEELEERVEKLEAEPSRQQ